MARPGRLLGVLLGAALGSLLLASPARADYRLCNRTSYVLEGAIALQADPKEPRSDWHSQGWARMLPGSCASALAGPIRGGSYYVFARSADVHQGPTKYFSGNESFCTLPKDFALTGRDNCAQAAAAAVGEIADLPGHCRQGGTEQREYDGNGADEAPESGADHGLPLFQASHPAWPARGRRSIRR